MAPKKAAAEEAVPETPPPPTAGTGKFYFKNGATYVGDWVLLFPQPPATPEGDKKPAKGKNDPPPPPAEPPRRVRHGKGVYTEGDYSYQGEFQEDVVQGQGKMTYASGAYYQGQWQAGVYNGHGKYVWPDGRSYEGEWQDNKMHGTGTYTDLNGHRWSGQFFNGSGPGLTPQL